MPIRFRVDWLPRRGNSPEEYEDAHAMNVEAGRFALADGAAESSYAGRWARLLVSDFVKAAERDPDRWTDGLVALQERWASGFRGRTLPWYTEAKVRQGAFSTFLGLVLTASPQGETQWHAVAVGDSCLFHTRGADLLATFPMERSDQFNNHPKLVGSRADPEVVRGSHSRQTDGRGLPGDRLWMMTDALAHWCLARHEAGGNPWEELESLFAPQETETPFDDWIERKRDTRGLHNDDVTLLAIEL